MRLGAGKMQVMLSKPHRGGASRCSADGSPPHPLLQPATPVEADDLSAEVGRFEREPRSTACGLFRCSRSPKRCALHVTRGHGRIGADRPCDNARRDAIHSDAWSEFHRERTDERVERTLRCEVCRVIPVETAGRVHIAEAHHSAPRGQR